MFQCIVSTSFQHQQNNLSTFLIETYYCHQLVKFLTMDDSRIDETRLELSEASTSHESSEVDENHDDSEISNFVPDVACAESQSER